MEFSSVRLLRHPEVNKAQSTDEPNSKSHSKCPDILTFKGPSEHLIALPTVSQPTKTILHFICPSSIPTCQKSSESTRARAKCWEILTSVLQRLLDRYQPPLQIWRHSVQAAFPDRTSLPVSVLNVQRDGQFLRE